MSIEGDAAAARLPEPPEVPRRLRLRLSQVVGLVLVGILPALAVLGVLEAGAQTGRAQAAGAQLQVSAPARMRYRVQDRILVDVGNDSGRPLPQAVVRLEAALLEGFAGVTITPEPARVEGSGYVVELGALGAGQRRRVVVQVQADEYGWRAGAITLQAGEARATVPVRIFVIP